jgi:hypothetical protein
VILAEAARSSGYVRDIDGNVFVDCEAGRAPNFAPAGGVVIPGAKAVVRAGADSLGTQTL